MNFYLLKSTVRRQKVGDVLIDLDAIESISLYEKYLDDRADPLYTLGVLLKSDNVKKAVFATLDEAKDVLKEMLGDKVSQKDIDDILPQVE